MPVLDAAGLGPEGEVDWFGGVEDFSQGGDVDGLHGFFFFWGGDWDDLWGACWC